VFALIKNYEVQYTSPWSTKDGEIRDVIVRVTDPTNSSITKQGIKTYIALTSSGGIYGKVTNVEDSTPIKEVIVEVSNESNALTYKTKTDENGEYSIPQIKPGTYKIVVSRLGFFDHKETIYISSDSSIEINFSLTPYTDFSKEEKYILIEELKAVKKYNDEEDDTKEYVDSLVGSTEEEKEALARLTLAERFVKAGHDDARVMAEDAGKGLGSTFSAVLTVFKYLKNAKGVAKEIPETISLPGWLGGGEIPNPLRKIADVVLDKVSWAVGQAINTLTDYAVQAIPAAYDWAKAVIKSAVSSIVNTLMKGEIEFSPADIIKYILEKITAPFLLSGVGGYEGFEGATDDYLERSLDAAKSSEFEVGTHAQDKEVVNQKLVEMQVKTINTHTQVESSLGNADIANTVGQIADVGSAIIAATGIGAAVAGVVQAISIISKATSLGFSGAATGISSYRILIELPNEVSDGTAAAFGKESWSSASWVDKSMASKGKAPRCMTNHSLSTKMRIATDNFNNKLDRLIDYIKTDDLLTAIDYFKNELFPSDDVLQKDTKAAEAIILSAGGNAFDVVPLFKARYEKLSSLSSQAVLTRVSFYLKFIAFFNEALTYDSPSDPDYLDSKENILIEAENLKRVNSVFASELNDAISSLSGFSIPATVIIESFKVTSDGTETTTITDSPQNFTVSVHIRNVSTISSK
jgi:hypothetical protein